MGCIKKGFLLSILYISSFLMGLNAQPYPSAKGLFQLDEKKGCAPLTISITSAACTSTSPCTMFFGDGTTLGDQFTHTYTQPGTYNLRILFSGGIGFDSLSIEVLPNPQPLFNIFTCNGNAVKVDADVPGNVYNIYTIDFNDGNVVTVPSGFANAQNTYATPGTKTVSVRGRYVGGADNCVVANQNVNAVAAQAAPIVQTLTVFQGDTLELDFLSSINTQYRLDIGVNGTNFQQLKQLYNKATDTIVNLRPDDNFYCFRLGAVDVCNGSITYSNTVCSINFDLTLQDSNNRLDWQTASAGNPNFDIQRDGSAYLLNLPASTRSQDDPDVTCNIEYCYIVTADYGTGIQSISRQKCGVAFSLQTPDAIADVNASVTATGLALTWQPSALFTADNFTVFRRSNSGLFSSIGNSATPDFTDIAYETSRNFCYRINYRDNCQNQSSDGIEACPIQLSGFTDATNTVNLSWTDYQGWQAGITGYTIEKYSQEGVLLGTFFNNALTTFVDNATTTDVANQVYVYKVFATSAAGLGNVYSNEIVVIKEPQLFYPTAFTPDGQGPAENDLFKVFGQYITSFDMKIFNRWGELLFTTNSLEVGWDGTYQGTPQPEGTYAFTASLTDFAGRTFKRSGSVLLLRKR